MKKSTTWVIVIVVILVVLGIILLSTPKGEAPEVLVPEAPEGEEAVVPEGEEAIVPAEEPVEEAGPLEGAETVVPGTSPVSEEGEVLTPAGEPVKSEALPGSPEAPKQSGALSEAEVPEAAVKLTATTTGFEPNEFSVTAGQAVTLAITSGDRTHVFKFDDPSLQGVAIGVAGNETRAITFKAPASSGDYTFYCDVPGHRGRGETGVMHVK